MGLFILAMMRVGSHFLKGLFYFSFSCIFPLFSSLCYPLLLINFNKICYSKLLIFL